MWFAVVVGFTIYKVLKGVFFDPSKEEIEGEQESRLKISIAKKLEQLYGGEVFLGLRIPDASTGTRLAIDMVLLTKREASVILVKDFKGILDVGTSGCWSLTNFKGQSESIPNLLEVAKHQASILEDYLERRGVQLHSGFMSYKVIFTNPKCRLLPSIASQPEVLPYEKWSHLGEETKSYVWRWAKNVFSGMEHDTSRKLNKQLKFILSTSPSWDRIQLKGNKEFFVVFVGFRGKKEDMDNLNVIKRSKVAKIFNCRSSVFDLLVPVSKVHLFYVLRDHRQDNTYPAEMQELCVRADTELLLQSTDSKKIHHLPIHKLVSISLSL
eukprot:TRINITY_DN4189_c0_g1_i1.p1 TRINITY_DN4189_c0_g1~~TRINITY_DN4189_c0_g1_i1.p1  ORF type:complete len:325 (-),score=48.29 TRINITY_DN4189_c0_g1_i1:421-1395(-)